MKKILYVTTVSSTINVFLVPHIKMLIDKGNRVDIACNLDQEVSKELLDYGVKLHKIDFSRNPISTNNIKAYKQILELQKLEKYDVVNVHTPVASFVTRLALRDENVRIIYTCHGFHFYKGAPLLNWILYYPMERVASRWTDTMVTINTEDKERAEKFKLRNDGQVELMHGVGIDPKEYELIEFDKERYRKQLGLKHDDFVILMIAELNKNKNHMQLINAMSLLKYKYPKIKVLCAGKGPLKEKLENKIKDLGLDKNIEFLGFRSDIKKLLNISDCITLFSLREGLGKCLLEGMIAGKPLIATDTRGPRELIENNANGYLVKVGDCKKTAQYIENIYLDKTKRLNFSKNSINKINEYYLKNVLDEVAQYY